MSREKKSVKLSLLSFALCFFFPMLITSDEANKCSLGYDALSATCKRCSYNYYRERLESNTYFPVSECQPKTVTEAPFTRTVWVSSASCADEAACLGTLNQPYDSILKAFLQINLEANAHQKSKLTFFLLGLEHYILVKDLSIIDYIPSYFGGLNSEIKITPWFCSMGMASGCIEDPNLKVKIYLKTNEFHIFFSGLLTLEQCIIDGGDIHLQKDYNLEECYNKKEICCDEAKRGEHSDDLCYLQGKAYDGYAELKGFGIFNSDFLFDDPEGPLPSLIISNSEFSNLNLYSEKYNGFFSFINIFHLPDSVSLSNLVFTNVYFEKGLISQFTPDYLSSITLCDTNSENSKKILKMENVSIALYNKYRLAPSNYNGITIFQFSGSNSLEAEFKAILISGLRSSSSENKAVLLFHFRIINKFRFADIVIKEMESHSFLLVDTVAELVLENIEIFCMKLFTILAKNYIQINKGAVTSINSLKLNLVEFFVEEAGVFFSFFSFFESVISIENLSIAASDSISFLVVASALTMKDGLIYSFFQTSSLVLIKNSFCHFNNVRFMEFFSTHSNLFYVWEENTLGNILFFENLLVDNCRFTYPFTPTKFINWPIANEKDEFILTGFTLKDCLIEGYEELRFIDWPFAFSIVISDISIINTRFFMLVSLNDFAFIKISNLKADGLINNDYLIAISCTKCTAFFEVFSLYNLFISDIDFIFLNVYNFDMNHISISNVIANTTFLKIFALTIFNDLAINNIDVKFLDLPSSPFPLDCIFYIVYANYVSVTNSAFSATFNSDLSKSVVMLFYYNSKVDLRNITIENYGCRSAIGNINFENGVLPFIGSDSYLDADYYLTADISDLKVRNCTECKNGVLGFLAIASISLSNSSFQHCSSKQGGAISIRNSIQTQIISVVFEKTIADRGGALFVNNVNDLICYDLIFTLTNAKYGGALGFVLAKRALCVNCLFSECSAENEGGAIHSKDSNLEFQGGHITNVWSLHDGGAIFLKNSTMKINQSFQAAELSAESGGFMYAYECPSLIFDDIKIENSKANSFGSAFLLFDSNSIEMNNVVLRLNQVKLINVPDKFKNAFRDLTTARSLGNKLEQIAAELSVT